MPRRATLADELRERLIQKLLPLYTLRAPMLTLPEEFEPTDANRTPDKALFGLPLSLQQLDDFEREYKCPTKGIEKLQDLVGFTKLSMRTPLRFVSKCDRVLCLYCNWLRKEKRPDMETVLTSLRTILHMDPDVSPMWYFPYNTFEIIDKDK